LPFCTVTWKAAPASTTCRHQLVSSVNIYWPSQTKERPVQPLLRFNPLLALPSGTTSFVPCAPSLSSRLRPRHRGRRRNAAPTHSSVDLTVALHAAMRTRWNNPNGFRRLNAGVLPPTRTKVARLGARCAVALRR
jgi:hypothetical protein